MALALDNTGYDVLNVVALKKMAGPQVIARDAGVEVTTVQAVLAALAEQGLVALGAGAALPTDDAEPTLRAIADRRYAPVRADADVERLVERFESINSQFLTTMSAWQQVDVGGRKVTNDHTDAEYDGRIVSRLDKLVTRLEPLLDALGGHDPRFGNYPRRFVAAIDQIDAGRTDFVSSPTLDSIHNIWFEFHEDLLRTMGRERTE
ncbi:MAG TPA: hypothetical protein VIC62_05105 [Nakamurella sp.]|jgi:hypothetical protein